MTRKAKTPGIISGLLNLITPRKLANRIGIKPTRLKKIETGQEKATKSEISKISHLNKLIPQQIQLETTLKKKKELKLFKEEVKEAKQAKTLKEIERFNRKFAKVQYTHDLTQKTLDYEDIRRLTGISRYELEKRIHRTRINVDTLRYSFDGLITAKDNLGIEKVLVREQWTDGRHPTMYVFMRKDILDAYIEFRGGNKHITGSDIWYDQTYIVIYKFGVYAE